MNTRHPGGSRQEHSRVVELNRAVAIGEAARPAAGLAAIDEIDPTGLPGRHLWHAARAEQLVRLDEQAAAATEFDSAVATAPSDAERRHLAQRRATLP